LQNNSSLICIPLNNKRVLCFFDSGSSEGSDKLKADNSSEGSFKLRLRMQDVKDVRDNKQIVPEKYETLSFIARLVNVMFFDGFSPLITNL